uniref:Uncharacterized protein n=1 Tax=Leersia perrieri TaxID=77586 RepID=A0A0D9XYJ2_9ORYZ
MSNTVHVFDLSDEDQDVVPPFTEADPPTTTLFRPMSKERCHREPGEFHRCWSLFNTAIVTQTSPAISNCWVLIVVWRSPQLVC